MIPCWSGGCEVGFARTAMRSASLKYTISRCVSLSFQNESTAAADGSMSTSLFTRSSLHLSEESTRVLNQSRRKTMGSTFGTLFSSSSSSAMVSVLSDRAGCASHPVHLLPLSLSLSRRPLDPEELPYLASLGFDCRAGHQPPGERRRFGGANGASTSSSPWSVPRSFSRPIPAPWCRASGSSSPGRDV